MESAPPGRSPARLPRRGNCSEADGGSTRRQRSGRPGPAEGLKGVSEPSPPVARPKQETWEYLVPLVSAWYYRKYNKSHNQATNGYLLKGAREAKGRIPFSL